MACEYLSTTTIEITNRETLLESLKIMGHEFREVDGKIYLNDGTEIKLKGDKATITSRDSTFATALKNRYAAEQAKKQLRKKGLFYNETVEGTKITLKVRG